MKANMKVLTKEKSEVLAEEISRTPEYEHGYAHGERSRKLNEAPPRYVMIGIDDYALGFRAGYFANVRMAPRAESVGRHPQGESEVFERSGGTKGWKS